MQEASGYDLAKELLPGLEEAMSLERADKRSILGFELPPITKHFNSGTGFDSTGAEGLKALPKGDELAWSDVLLVAGRPKLNLGILNIFFDSSVGVDPK